MLTKNVKVKAINSRFSTVNFFYCVLLLLVINMTTLSPAHQFVFKKTYRSSLAMYITYELTNHVFFLYLGFCIVV